MDTATPLARRLDYYCALAHAEALDLLPNGATPEADSIGRLKAWQRVTVARTALSPADQADAFAALDLAEAA